MFVTVGMALRSLFSGESNVEGGGCTSGCFGPEVCTGGSVGAVVECLPVVQGGIDRNSSKVRTCSQVS